MIPWAWWVLFFCWCCCNVKVLCCARELELEPRVTLKSCLPRPGLRIVCNYTINRIRRHAEKLFTDTALNFIFNAMFPGFFNCVSETDYDTR